MNIFVRFERGKDDIIGPTFGPYSFVQLTYNDLRVVDKDGEDVDLAAFNDDDQEWHIESDSMIQEALARRIDYKSCHNVDSKLIEAGRAFSTWYSDVIIFSEPDPSEEMAKE